MPIYNSSYTGIQIDAAVAKYFVLENDGGAASKNWVNSMLEGYQPLGSYVTTTSLNSTLADYSTSSIIASNYLSKTDAANTYQLKGSYAAASHSHSYLPLSGGTLTGSLTFANNTWNVVGDDCAIGDVNSAGALGIKGQNGTTNLRFIQYNGTAAGTLSWSGSSFNFSAPIDNHPVIKTGYNTLSKTSSSSLGSATVYYATGRINFGYTFKSKPVVICTANDLAGGVFTCEIDGGIDTTGFNVTVYGADTATYGVYWAAIGN